MEKEKIVEIFLNNGLILDSETLEYFCKNPKQIKNFLEKFKNKEKPPILRMDLIKKFLEEEIRITEIKKKVLEKKNVFSVNDVFQILYNRYEKIKSFFSYRMDIVNLISINRINDKTKKFSLIGMIREIDKEKKSAIVEDFTGEVLVFFKTNILNYIVQDEVVGLVCEKIDDKIEVLNVLWPDIPLKRNIVNLEDDVCCIFISNECLEKNEENFLEKILKLSCKKNLIFLFVETIDKNQIENLNKKLPKNFKLIIITKEEIKFEDINCFSTPAFLLVEEKINLLLCDGRIFSPYFGVLGEKTEDIMLNLLKKRHLSPVFSMEKVLEEEYLLIEPVPDIFVSFNFGPSGLINYKGTTIISCGSSEKIFWIVNLKTRESLKINLDIK